MNASLETHATGTVSLGGGVRRLDPQVPIAFNFSVNTTSSSDVFVTGTRITEGSSGSSSGSGGGDSGDTFGGFADYDSGVWAWNTPTGSETAELDSTSHVVEETSGSGASATTNQLHSELSNSTGSANFESTLITSTNGSSTTTTTGYNSSSGGVGHMARVLTPIGTNGVSFAFGGLAAQNGSPLSVAPNISTGGQVTSFFSSIPSSAWNRISPKLRFAACQATPKHSTTASGWT